ncbi:peptide-methionine (S)-S-oxide reductase [Cochleicola gelatinilyticus]|uniref:peptide-methionine (S)-S-oxide reductase n=1 Tax=Cochleicola gelatinilyticus TaxID=1763537 RepID=A0A167ERP5_9FLAO|nr:peptide-methionine (S)-S-oxide reductase [Cochleicola gelatinilyticus]OAB75815.1 peptide methionine sulfoxide reductase [Cochleicola gelatinilyticus]
MNTLQKIGLGGGCHWCTEAVFQLLKGVTAVAQGYIASDGENTSFSEAVIVTFNTEVISLHTLLSVHLQSHKSRSNHSFREKYRSAVYYFSEEQKQLSIEYLREAQEKLQLENGQNKNAYITKVLPYKGFRESRESLQNYFRKNPEAPFCQRYIVPKLVKIPSEIKKNNHSILTK